MCNVLSLGIELKVNQLEFVYQHYIFAGFVRENFNSNLINYFLIFEFLVPATNYIAPKDSIKK